MQENKNTKNSVLPAQYGSNVAIARKLGVSPAHVSEVRCRMRNGFTNFYSEKSKKIYRALLKAEKCSSANIE